MKKWKGKKVVWFDYEKDGGFYPVRTAEVIEETDEECLIRTSLFNINLIKITRTFWTFKYDEEAVGRTPQYQIKGYCKLIK